MSGPTNRGGRPTAGIEPPGALQSLPKLLVDRVGHWSVFSQCFGKKLDGEGPGGAWLALVVDPAVYTIHTFYQARDDKAWEHVLERALGGESMFLDQVRWIDTTVGALRNGRHYGESVSLPEQSVRDLLNSLRLGVRHADIVLRHSRYGYRVTYMA